MVLFTRLLEIYSVTKEDGDEPLHSVTFDSQQTSFGFVSPTELVVSDDKGRLTFFTNIESEEAISMRIAQTACGKIRSLSVAPDFSFFITVANEQVAFWNVARFRTESQKEASDAMFELKPDREVK